MDGEDEGETDWLKKELEDAEGINGMSTIIKPMAADSEGDAVEEEEGINGIPTIFRPISTEGDGDGVVDADGIN